MPRRYGPQKGQTDKWGKPKRKYNEPKGSDKDTKDFMKKFKADQKKNR